MLHFYLTGNSYFIHVVLLVGDEVSCNLALIKRLCGYANEQLWKDNIGDDPPLT